MFLEPSWGEVWKLGPAFTTSDLGFQITKWTSVVVLVRLVYNGLQGLPCPPVLLRDWQGFFFLVR